jgi:hypothetical protein
MRKKSKNKFEINCIPICFALTNNKQVLKKEFSKKIFKIYVECFLEASKKTPKNIITFKEIF